MGLFDFIKKYKKGNAEKDDFDILSGSGMLKYIRSNLKNPSDENVLKALDNLAKPDDDLEHLTADGELPWGWHTHNKEFLAQIRGEYSYFLNYWLDARKKSPKELQSALNSFILYMEDIERLCKSKGECFEFYFYTAVASPDYIQKRKEELEKLEKDIVSLQKEYVTKQQNLIGLEEKVIQKLIENDGILQADFVKLFHPSVKNEITEMLYYWDKAGKLVRQKSGRSYTLHFRG